MDYNLFGMNLIHLNWFKFRRRPLVETDLDNLGII